MRSIFSVAVALYCINAAATEMKFLCKGVWETCQESGTEVVLIEKSGDACNKLYEATAADLVHSVECAAVAEDGTSGPYKQIFDRCE